MSKYIIINAEAIQKRIEELEKEAKSFIPAHQSTICYKKVDELNQILSQSTPLIPEIEKSFDAGHRICKGGFMYIPSKRDYIANLKLDI